MVGHVLIKLALCTKILIDLILYAFRVEWWVNEIVMLSPSAGASWHKRIHFIYSLC